MRAFLRGIKVEFAAGRCQIARNQGGRVAGLPRPVTGLPPPPNRQVCCEKVVDKVTDGGIIKSALLGKLVGGGCFWEGPRYVVRLFLKNPPSFTLKIARRHVLLYSLAKGRDF